MVSQIQKAAYSANQEFSSVQPQSQNLVSPKTHAVDALDHLRLRLSSGSCFRYRAPEDLVAQGIG